jgi:NAD(P)-dependent dehydrogenase (short-subunit alcohol dehydrogenase family)
VQRSQPAAEAVPAEASPSPSPEKVLRWFLAGRTATTLETTRDEIIDRGGRAIATLCDVTSLADIGICVASALDTYGSIDILVNNAALVPHGSLVTISEELANAAWIAGPIATLRLIDVETYRREDSAHFRERGFQ